MHLQCISCFIIYQLLHCILKLSLWMLSHISAIWQAFGALMFLLDSCVGLFNCEYSNCLTEEGSHSTYLPHNPLQVSFWEAHIVTLPSIWCTYIFLAHPSCVSVWRGGGGVDPPLGIYYTHPRPLLFPHPHGAGAITATTIYKTAGHILRSYILDVARPQPITTSPRRRGMNEYYPFRQILLHYSSFIVS